MEKEKIEWQEYLRSNVNLRIISYPIRGLYEGLKKHFDDGVRRLAVYFKGDTCYWNYDQKDIYQAGKLIIGQLGDQELRKRFFSAWDTMTRETLDFLEAYPAARLATSPQDELVSIYKKYNELMSGWYGASMAIDPTDEYLMGVITERIRSILKNELGPRYRESEFTRAYEILTSPSEQSYLNEERKMLADLALSVQKGEIEEKDPEFLEKAEAVRKKFWWTGLGWKREEGRGVEEVIQEVRSLAALDNLAETIAKDEGYAARTAENKKELDSVYKFYSDEELKNWLEIFDELVWYHDSRKEVQMKSNYWEYRFFDAVYEVTEFERGLFDWCLADEIEAGLSGGAVDREEIKKRASQCFFYRNGDEVLLAGGEAAGKAYAETISLDLSEVRDIQGTGASRGYAVGPAYVATTIDEAMKIEAGHILVTGMTTPDYVPAMKKAAAIVTDEGGITCHAAIVSRELGIPCIVGTKFATRTIKTGQVIEVKANHGTVVVKD